MNQATPDGHTMPPVRQRAVNTLTELDRWVDETPGWDLGAYVGAVLHQADIEGA